MLKILGSFIKLAHAAIITHICMELSSSSPTLCLQTIGIELGFTLTSILVTRKHRFDLLQVAISLFLTYTLIPNNYSFLSGLFFFKIIYVFNALGEAADDLLSAPGNILTKLFKILLHLFRYTLAQYLFLGLCLLAYKLYCMGDPEGPLPQDYLTFYSLVVTATTIGYGDITPKTKWQTTFFTYCIPFMCASFVIYFNAAIPIIGDLIDTLSGNAIISSDEGCNSPDAFSSKFWSSEEKENFVNFIDEVAKRQAEHEEHHKRMGHNWIALSANHFERQIPLINNILRGDESKEVRLKISSKVRRQYYPAGWIVLQAGDVSEDLMMVDEGDVKTPAPEGKSFVFNKEGFLRGSASSICVVTTSFVSMWAVSLKDLKDLGKTSSQIKQIVSQLSGSS